MEKLFRQMETARANLISAIQNSQKHEAEGILLTSWGDCGNHQPWATLYPPLVLGAQLAWSGQDATDTEIGDFIDHTIFDALAVALENHLLNWPN